MLQAADKQILLLIQADPQSGLARLLERYGCLIRTITGRILPGFAQDAEECAADVLVAVWRDAGKLVRTQCPLHGWLVVTTRNMAITRYRSLKRSKAIPWPDGFEVADLEMIEPKTTEKEDLIAELVANLPPPDREIFMRRYYYLQPSKEIGAALDMTEHAVNVRLSRGREKLKRQLQGKLPEGGFENDR